MSIRRSFPQSRPKLLASMGHDELKVLRRGPESGLSRGLKGRARETTGFVGCCLGGGGRRRHLFVHSIQGTDEELGKGYWLRHPQRHPRRLLAWITWRLLQDMYFFTVGESLTLIAKKSSSYSLLERHKATECSTVKGMLLRDANFVLFQFRLPLKLLFFYLIILEKIVGKER